MNVAISLTAKQTINTFAFGYDNDRNLSQSSIPPVSHNSNTKTLLLLLLLFLLLFLLLLLLLLLLLDIVITLFVCLGTIRAYLCGECFRAFFFGQKFYEYYYYYFFCFQINIQKKKLIPFIFDTNI